MARAIALLWACTLVLVAADVVVVTANENIGINWGMLSSHPLHPSIVVNMLKDNGFKKVKLFDSDPLLVNFFAGTDIEVMLGIPNDMLSDLADDYDNAKDWVKENLTKHLHNGGVNIKYVAVGNEPFLKANSGKHDQTIFPATKNIQKAINGAGVGDKIKVTIPCNAAVYESASNKPSDGVFRSDIRHIMTQIVHYLKENGSPFLVNIYPFLSLSQGNGTFPEQFAFFEGGHPINDKNVQYDNVFDANFDTLVTALKKVGVPDLKIIVGEVGWPTDGEIAANINYANKFYDGLLKKIASNKGTPLRRGKIEVYLFGLIDEDMKSVEPGSFERHWGIFTFDGKAKFPMDLSGKGNDNNLVGAKGVKYLPKQWCVFDNQADDTDELPNQMSWVCSHADCTSLQPGGSCSNLDTTQKYSYAFNIFYQTNDQDDESCNLKGLGKVVKEDPSTRTCKFPIQIVSAGHANSFSFSSGATIAFVSMLSLFTFV